MRAQWGVVGLGNRKLPARGERVGFRGGRTRLPTFAQQCGFVRVTELSLGFDFLILEMGAPRPALEVVHGSFCLSSAFRVASMQPRCITSQQPPNIVVHSPF